MLAVLGSGSLAQESVVKTGSYLDSRGPYDPRPYQQVHLADRLFLGTDFLETKNQRWIEQGFAYGGYFSFNFQLSSEDSSSHGMGDSFLDGEFLYLAEAGFGHDMDCPNETIFRVTASHLDLDGDNPEDGPGQLLMVSAERQLGLRAFE